MMLKTLKQKMVLIYFFLVCIIAIVGAVSVTNLYTLSRATDRLMIHNYKSLHAASNMSESLERQDSAVLTYLYVDQQNGIDIFTENQNEFIKWYNIESNNITEVGEDDLVKRLDQHYIDYTKMFAKLQEIQNTHGLEVSEEFYKRDMLEAFLTIKKLLSNILAINEEAMFRSKEEAADNALESMYLMLFVTAISVIGGFLIALLLTYRFLKPIDVLTQTMKKVRDGGLYQQIDIISNDEIGELAIEFNNMTSRLQQYEKSTLGKLIAEENKSLAIVKNISEPLLVLDRSYRIILLNPACEKLFQVEELNVVNKHLQEVVHLEELYDYLSHFCEKDERNKEKVIAVDSEGEMFYYKVITTKVINDVEKVTGIIMVLQDITQWKHLEKVKTDFVATISHEFKTPLTSIMMGISLLVDENIGRLNERQKRVIETIQEDGERLSNLVNDLLQLSKLESAAAIYRMRSCSIVDIIEKAIKPFYTKAEQNEVKLHFEKNVGMPDIYADDEKIIWVMNNLLSNALKYTHGGDEIRITVAARLHEILVAVKDTGIGIPDAYKEKIFDKFVQVKGYDIEVRGTGLGLAVVKDIVEAHGGQIWYTSEIDVGSTFYFTIPIVERGVIL